MPLIVYIRNWVVFAIILSTTKSIASLQKTLHWKNNILRNLKVTIYFTKKELSRNDKKVFNATNGVSFVHQPETILFQKHRLQRRGLFSKFCSATSIFPRDGAITDFSRGQKEVKFLGKDPYVPLRGCNQQLCHLPPFPRHIISINLRVHLFHKQNSRISPFTRTQRCCPLRHFDSTTAKFFGVQAARFHFVFIPK